ncbi:MAG: hypothetical protein WD794_04925 [Mycobacteriales bacterium]
MTASHRAVLPSPRPAADVLDLHVVRMGGERAVTAMAAAPVRHVPAALLDALHGSWGTPQELAPARPAQPPLRLVAG